MSHPRVVLVTRRFWPLVGGAESVMARLGAALVRRGSDTTVLTARWASSWPEQFVHHGVRVVRLPQSRLRFLGTLEYMRAVARWLNENRESFDLVYVSMFKHDAYAAVGVGKRRRFPVAIRAEGGGFSGDMHWQLQATCGRRIKRRCYQAAATIAPSRAIEREIIAAGYPRERIHYIPNGVPFEPLEPPLDTASREEAAQNARRVLATASAQLRLPAPNSPLVLFAGRLDETKGLETLIRCWPQVIAGRPQARLWIVGEGPHRDTLLSAIRDTGCESSILLPGAFDNVDELLAAANVFVLPSREEGLSIALLEAIAAGVPVVASDIPGNRQLIDDQQHGLLVPKEDADALAAAIIRQIENPERGLQMAQHARQRAADQFSLDAMVGQHLELFERLLAEQR